MRDLGFKDLSIDRLVEFRIHGVTPEFVKAWSDLGYKNLDADDYVTMRIHGVTPQLVKELSDLGYKNLAVSRPGQDAHPRRDAGLHQADARRRLRRAAGSTSSSRSASTAWTRISSAARRRTTSTNLSADDLIDLAIHGRRWLKG